MLLKQWTWIFGTLAGLSFNVVSLLGLAMPAAFLCAFCFLLSPEKRRDASNGYVARVRSSVSSDVCSLAATKAPPCVKVESLSQMRRKSSMNSMENGTGPSSTVSNAAPADLCPDDLSLCGKMFYVCGLWPYIVPLFTVYFAEYLMQTGTWSSIGFPIDSKDARDNFYQVSRVTVCNDIKTFPLKELVFGRNRG